MIKTKERGFLPEKDAGQVTEPAEERRTIMEAGTACAPASSSGPCSDFLLTCVLSDPITKVNARSTAVNAASLSTLPTRSLCTYTSVKISPALISASTRLHGDAIS